MTACLWIGRAALPTGAEVGRVAIPPELVEGVLRDKVVWKIWEYVHHPDGRRAAPGPIRPIAPSGKPAVVGVEGPRLPLRHPGPI